MVQRQLRPRRTNLQQIAQIRRSRFARLRREGRKRRLRQRRTLLRRSNHRLQRPHRQRLPAVRLCLIRLAEAHKTVVRQLAQLGRRNYGAIASLRLIALLRPKPQIPHVLFNLRKTECPPIGAGTPVKHLSTTVCAMPIASKRCAAQ